MAPAAALPQEGGGTQAVAYAFGAEPAVLTPPDNTALPMLQSVTRFQADHAGPDATANGGGAVLTILHADGATGVASYALSIPGLGLDKVTLVDQGKLDPTAASSPERYTANLPSGGALEFDMAQVSSAAAAIWTLSGASGVQDQGFSVTGFETPNIAVAKQDNETLIYSGSVYGVVTVPDGASYRQALLSGTVGLIVSAGSGQVSGTITGVTAQPTAGGAAQPWDALSLTGSLAGVTFSGATSVTSSPGGAYSLSTAATGHLDGAIYTNDVGAVWSLSDGTEVAQGVFLGTFGSESNTCSGASASVGSGPCPAPPPSSHDGVLVGPAAVGGPRWTALNGGPVSDPTSLPTDNSAFSLSQAVIHLGGGEPTENATAESQGATLTVSHVHAADGRASLVLSIPGLGIDALPLVDAGIVAAGQGGTEVYANVGSPILALTHLDYLAYGNWQQGLDQGEWIGGYVTPVASMPSSGSASYVGKTTGDAARLGPSGVGTLQSTLSGDVQITANFGAGSLSGAITNVTTRGIDGTTQAWNNVSLTATLSGAAFSGTSAATSDPGTDFSLASSATGTVKGGFYGPSAQEVGAVWTLSDGVRRAAGSLGAAKP